MDPITVMTLASIGFSAYGQLKASSAQRKQMRQQAELQRQQANEMEYRTQFNLGRLQEEGRQIQGQVASTMAASGASVSSGLAQMNNVANAIARESTIARREADFQIRAVLSGASNLQSAERDKKRSDFINILGGTAFSAASAYNMRPREGGTTTERKSLLG
jgi:hypothetical protein